MSVSFHYNKPDHGECNTGSLTKSKQNHREKMRFAVVSDWREICLQADQEGLIMVGFKSFNIRLVIVFLIGLMLVLFTPTRAANGPSLTLVSGPSPFASCMVGSGPGAINFTNAEVEPYVAVNPTNSKNVIGVW